MTSPSRRRRRRPPRRSRVPGRPIAGPRDARSSWAASATRAMTDSRRSGRGVRARGGACACPPRGSRAPASGSRGRCGTAGGGMQRLECPQLDLAYALDAEIEALADLVERALLAVEPEAAAHDEALALAQPRQQGEQLGGRRTSRNELERLLGARIGQHVAEAV